MKILVTGGAGMLGSALVPALIKCGHDVVNTDIDTLDVRSVAEIEYYIDRELPDLVAHLAAETSLEVCENDPDHAWLTNALGTKNVALTCRRASIPMAYISSAGVFDGTKESAYTEFDTPNPINIYGASKYEGEKFVRQFVDEHYIIRAGWMMGGGNKRDHKFISLIMDQIQSGAKTILAVNDKFGTPTYAPDFSMCFENIIESGQFGTYHVASPGSCSRFEVATAIVAILGRDDIAVRPASSTYFVDKFFAPRPSSEIMRNYVLDLENANTMRPWRDALAEYLEEWS